LGEIEFASEFAKGQTLSPEAAVDLAFTIRQLLYANADHNNKL
jgi:hypothetical protein